MLEKYFISVAGSSKSTHWKRRGYTWGELFTRLSQPTVDSDHTVRQYDLLSRNEKAILKDVGGFVGGTLSGGRRTKSAVTARSLITLDVDYATDDFFLDFCIAFPCEAVIYGTRSDRPNNRRYRLIIPLDREIEYREEYEAASRKVAEILGIELFDPTTFQAERLMYWGSVCSDQEYYFDYQFGDALCVDDILDLYGGGESWKDTSLWAYHDEEEKAVKLAFTECQDPTEKSGVVGAFCRSYTISQAIDSFLFNVYEHGDKDDRFTYIGGTSANGLIVYNDLLAYSHHATDPVGDGHAYNAYDLVRVHSFGHLGKKESENEMSKVVLNDEKCKSELVAVKKDISGDFDIEDEATEVAEDITSLNWDLDSKGKKLVTIANFVNAFKSDPLLNKLIGFDEFKGVPVYLRRPFFSNTINRGDNLLDEGDSVIANRIETLHDGLYSQQKLDSAINIVAMENSCHPIKDYLAGLEWDFEPRIDGFLHKFMGADDNVYTSEAFRKMLVGAVARIRKPGTKFDTALIMVSKQGIGKSRLIERLSKGWYNDSLVTLEGTKAYEAIQKSWLVELAELSAVRRSDVETMKNFITKTEDTYRAAYAHHVHTHKRQCVFFGSTNDESFLKDQTGNRRFFPVHVEATEHTKFIHSQSKDFDDYIDQMWAEAVFLYEMGESLVLSPEAERIAECAREEFTEASTFEGSIERYVNMEFPDDWDDLDYLQKRDFASGIGVQPRGTVKRDEFSAFEIWCFCIGGERKDFSPAKAREITASLQRLGFTREKAQKTVKLLGRQRIYARPSSLS